MYENEIGTEEGFIPYDNLFYGSTHEKDNFPGTGKDPSPYVGDKAKHPLHRRIVNRYLNPRANRFDEGKSVREEFRVKWTEIIEEMILFKPEFIIFSAGFDAHDADPLAWCDLLEEDYQWATEIVLAACVRINPISLPRCISVLEGGYDLEALSLSALAHLQALEKGYPLTGDSFLDRSNMDILIPNPSDQNKDLNGLIKASNKLQASIDEATKTLENLGIK
jgi:acetoin utilization deacetylase AcuC-like enzyme